MNEKKSVNSKIPVAAHTNLKAFAATNAINFTVFAENILIEASNNVDFMNNVASKIKWKK